MSRANRAAPPGPTREETAAKDLFQIAGQYRTRDERRSQTPDPAMEMPLVTKVSEEAN